MKSIFKSLSLKMKSELCRDEVFFLLSVYYVFNEKYYQTNFFTFVFSSVSWCELQGNCYCISTGLEVGTRLILT